MLPYRHSILDKKLTGKITKLKILQKKKKLNNNDNNYYYNNNNNNNNNNNDNNNNNNNNKKNSSYPVVLKHRISIWRQITMSHGQVGVFSLGWKPS